jgi:hypothetical protein
MTFQENENEPVNLTEEMRSEITEDEPIDSSIRVLEPEDEEERFEETMESTDTAKVQNVKPERKKTRKSNVMRKNPTRNEPESRPISKLHSELRKHSDARKRTDLAILDIRKELKDLLLVDHATIRDLKKQVLQMHRKIATLDNSKKSTKSKTIGRKTSSGRKTASGRKSKKKSSNRKSRKR